MLSNIVIYSNFLLCWEISSSEDSELISLGFFNIVRNICQPCLSWGVRNLRYQNAGTWGIGAALSRLAFSLSLGWNLEYSNTTSVFALSDQILIRKHLDRRELITQYIFLRFLSCVSNMCFYVCLCQRFSRISQSFYVPL